MPTSGSLADLEVGGGVVRAQCMARSDAAEAAYTADAAPIPLLRGLEPELEGLRGVRSTRRCSGRATRRSRSTAS